MGMYAATGRRAGVCAGVVGLVAALAAPTIGGPTLRAQQTPGADEVLYDMADSLGMLRTNAETDMFMEIQDLSKNFLPLAQATINFHLMT